MSEKPFQRDIQVIYAAVENRARRSMRSPVVRSIYVIECCTTGKGSVFINGKEFPFSAGMCYALLPGDSVMYTTDPTDNRGGVWCALDGLQTGQCLKQAGITSDSPFFNPHLYDDIRSWLTMMADFWQCRDAGASLRQNACALGLMGTILLNQPTQETNTLIDKAIGFMQTNYHTVLNIANIADQVGLERTYFSKVFKEKTGFSPYQYLMKLRVQYACQFLGKPEYSVSDVAYMVGLDPHNFSRLFHKETGLSPSDYQRKNTHDATLIKARTVRIK